ncbi:hypothetical protein [Roseomonas elaeocarpi]|uniref:Uncharacterized protein n=1 Tax=Roseomonas elaeocarpi TaxID=907779 RepID=A0ABV6JPR1_9PROT
MFLVAPLRLLQDQEEFRRQFRWLPARPEPHDDAALPPQMRVPLKNVTPDDLDFGFHAGQGQHCPSFLWRYDNKGESSTAATDRQHIDIVS